MIINVTFINSDLPSTAVFGVASIAGKTEEKNGGFTYITSGLVLINSPNLVAFRWIHEAVIEDLDGSLTGKP